MSDDFQRLVRSLERAEFTAAPAVMLALMAQLFDDPAVDAQRLSEPALRLLAHADDLEEQPLLHRVLRRTIVTDLEWERIFIRLRQTTPPEECHLPLLVSLAMQAWNNQFVWAGEPPPAGESVAERVLAAAFSPRFAIRGDDRDDDRLAPLIRQRVDEPAMEEETRRAFEEITAGDDIVARVARQYEQFPYPRYVAVPRRRTRTVAEYLAEKIGVSVPFTGSPRCLVAGTGTGHDALGLAQLFAGCRVVAFDLSAASLAYGARMARQGGIGNVEFVRASIEDVLGWTRRFDLVEAIGVLHHTADIERSWRTLLGPLEPGGLMRIGLYDRDQQRWREEYRRFTAGVDPRSRGALRRTRAAIIAAGAGRIAQTLDFYSMSGFRDLLFHEHQTSVTREEIASMSARLGLRLLGFEEGFGSMLCFWVQKPQ